MKSFNFFIEHQCPQCGAPAILQETDRLFTCEYCRVKSYLMEQGFFRYMLPHAAPENQHLVFFPYWRFKGMLFFCVQAGIRQRFVDISHQAVDSRCFPISVGLRSQALSLKFVSPDTNGYFLKPTQPFEKVIQIIDHRFSASLTKPIFHRSHIGETVSLIYSPFYINRKLYDAVLNRPVSSSLPDDFDPTSMPGGHPGRRIRFLPTLCPNCGWELHGERDSLVLDCENCGSVWRPGKKKFEKMTVAHIPEKRERIIFMPFWRISANIAGITLNSYADLLQVANLPKVARKGWEEMKFHFWTPAFKVRPQLFLRLSTYMTLSVPPTNLVPEMPGTRFYPVTLPVKEGVETLKILLANFIKPRNVFIEKLCDIHIKPKSFLLVFIPFISENQELIQPTHHLVINKNVLGFAKNL
ncbi:MAG: hypothetical protein ACE5DO_10075 [Desulfobacterales bacterium]